MRQLCPQTPSKVPRPQVKYAILARQAGNTRERMASTARCTGWVFMKAVAQRLRGVGFRSLLETWTASGPRLEHAILAHRRSNTRERMASTARCAGRRATPPSATSTTSEKRPDSPSEAMPSSSAALPVQRPQVSSGEQLHGSHTHSILHLLHV